MGEIATEMEKRRTKLVNLGSRVLEIVLKARGLSETEISKMVRDYMAAQALEAAKTKHQSDEALRKLLELLGEEIKRGGC